MTVVLRDYQSALLKQAREASRTTKRVCLYGPTGSGKTEVGLELVRLLTEAGRRVTWVVNRIDLLEQTSERFDDHGIDHGIVQRKHYKTDSTKPVQIASIATVNRRKMTPGLDVVIVDEAHGAISPTYRKYLDSLDVPVFGLTATPFSKGLGKVFGALVASTTIRELTEQGWLVPARYFAPDRPDLAGVRITAGDWNEKDLDARLNTVKLVGNIIVEWKKRAAQMKTIVFASSIAHSQAIVEQFKIHGVTAEHIDAYSKPADRKAIIKRFRNGQTRVISNVAVLAEGFDVPDAECMVLARPTRSIIRYLQMVGRILRPAPGKTEALVLDHSSTVERLGFADDWRELELDDGTSRVTKHDKVVMPPHTCTVCQYVTKRKTYPCPACGFKPDPQQIHLDVADGTLKEIRSRHLATDEKQVIYSALYGYAMRRGYKSGWVAHQYRAILGVWPKGLSDDPGPMVPVVKNHITAAAIRYAASRAQE